MSKASRILARALLGCTVAAALLLLVEAGLRAGGVEPPYIADAATWITARDLVNGELGGPAYPHPFKVNTNPDGLRTSISRERVEGTRRLALMGDSTVFGWGVGDGGTMAVALEKVLGAQYAYVGPVEVLNAGQPGYSTTQSAWIFEEVVRHYQPDLVVMFMPGHDANLVVVSDREALYGGRRRGRAVQVALARYSRIYQIMRLVLFPRAREAFLQPVDYEGGRRRVPRVSDEERGLAYDAVLARLAEWGGRLVVGALPWETNLVRTHKKTPDHRQGLDWMVAWGAERGVTVLDLRDCCGRRGRALLLDQDPGHYSEVGNRRIAEAMAPSLVVELWSPAAR